MTSDTDKLIRLADAISEKLYDDRELWQKTDFNRFVEHVVSTICSTSPPPPPPRTVLHTMWSGDVETDLSKRRARDYTIFMAGYHYAKGQSTELPYMPWRSAKK